MTLPVPLPPGASLKPSHDIDCHVRWSEYDTPAENRIVQVKTANGKLVEVNQTTGEVSST